MITNPNLERAVSFLRAFNGAHDAEADAVERAVRALWLIMGRDAGCERLTTGPGACWSQAHWTPDAEYTDDRWCNSCTALAALVPDQPPRIASQLSGEPMNAMFEVFEFSCRRCDEMVEIRAEQEIDGGRTVFEVKCPRCNDGVKMSARYLDPQPDQPAGDV